MQRSRARGAVGGQHAAVREWGVGARGLRNTFSVGRPCTPGSQDFFHLPEGLVPRCPIFPFLQHNKMPIPSSASGASVHRQHHSPLLFPACKSASLISLPIFWVMSEPSRRSSLPAPHACPRRGRRRAHAHSGALVHRALAGASHRPGVGTLSRRRASLNSAFMLALALSGSGLAMLRAAATRRLDAPPLCAVRRAFPSVSHLLLPPSLASSLHLTRVASLNKTQRAPPRVRV